MSHIVQVESFCSFSFILPDHSERWHNVLLDDVTCSSDEEDKAVSFSSIFVKAAAGRTTQSTGKRGSTMKKVCPGHLLLPLSSSLSLSRSCVLCLEFTVVTFDKPNLNSDSDHNLPLRDALLMFGGDGVKAKRRRIQKEDKEHKEQQHLEDNVNDTHNPELQDAWDAAFVTAPIMIWQVVLFFVPDEIG